jgi:molybdopterin-binding protein
MRVCSTLRHGTRWSCQASQPRLTEVAFDSRIRLLMARNRKPQTRRPMTEELLKPREAALELRISFPTIKQWIYKKKIRSIRTAGGHHRIPQSEVDRLLFRTRARTAPERTLVMRRLSGRNQLVGRVESVRISGLMAEVVISIGEQQITSIITARSAREMNLKAGQTAAALVKSTEVMILRV